MSTPTTRRNNNQLHRTAMLWLVCAMVLFVSPGAQATYVDPGAGHLLFQALGVALFGTLFYLKQIFAAAKRAVEVFRRRDLSRR